MPPVKIVYLITELSIGGAQFALLRLLRGLDRRRFQPLVLCLFNGEGRVAQEIRLQDVPVEDLRMTSKWRLDALWRLYRALRREQPALLHTWLFHANFSGRILGRLAGVPLIVSAERTMGMEGRARMWLNRLSTPLADRILCVSPQVASFAAQEIGLPADKLVVIPNGLDCSEFSAAPGRQAARQALGLAEDGLWIGSLGRLEPVKGFDLLLDAFALILVPGFLPEQIALHLRLAIVGDGPERPALQVQAQRLGITDRLVFLGETHQVPLFMAGLDLFALASRHEGMPNALLEAMAAGLPVVSTRAGGALDVVLPDQTGLLVPIEQPGALAQALARLLVDEAFRRRLGEAGRQRVQEHFSIQTTVQRTQWLYEELLATQASLSKRPFP